MAGLKQAKRVSWPTDGNLCKVRLFLSEDAPSQSVLGTQDQLQAKATWLLHAAGLSDSDDSLPPGFEAPQKYHHPKIEISQIPLIKWQCPPRLILNSEWLVVAGEESKEVAIENLRQSGVLEAIYPRPSSVPLNPFVTPDIQAAHFDDSCTPSIPITAIEDEDGVEQLDTSSVPNNLPALLHNLQNNGTLQNSLADLRSTYEQLQSQSSAASSMPNLPRLEQPPSSSLTPTATAALLAEPDVFAAASAAFTAIMKSSEEGSLIDHELLINILSDPVMVKRLASEYGDSQPQQTPPPQSQPVVSAQAAYSRPPIQSVVNTQAAPSRATTLQPNVSKSPAIPSWSATPPVVTATVAGPSRALPSQMSAPQSSHVFHMPHRPPPPPPHILSTIAPVRAPPPVRDANYYKSLIQLHGGEKQEARAKTAYASQIRTDLFDSRINKNSRQIRNRQSHLKRPRPILHLLTTLPPHVRRRPPPRPAAVPPDTLEIPQHERQHQNHPLRQKREDPEPTNHPQDHHPVLGPDVRPQPRNQELVGPGEDQHRDSAVEDGGEDGGDHVGAVGPAGGGGVEGAGEGGGGGGEGVEEEEEEADGGGDEAEGEEEEGGAGGGPDEEVVGEDEGPAGPEVGPGRRRGFR